MMGWTCSSEERNICRILARKLLAKRPFGSERDQNIILKSVLEKQVKGVGKIDYGW
jgi:hypothetical protein